MANIVNDRDFFRVCLFRSEWRICFYFVLYILYNFNNFFHIFPELRDFFKNASLFGYPLLYYLTYYRHCLFPYLLPVWIKPYDHFIKSVESTVVHTLKLNDWTASFGLENACIWVQKFVYGSYILQLNASPLKFYRIIGTLPFWLWFQSSSGSKLHPYCIWNSKIAKFKTKSSSWLIILFSLILKCVRSGLSIFIGPVDKIADLKADFGEI